MRQCWAARRGWLLQTPDSTPPRTKRGRRRRASSASAFPIVPPRVPSASDETRIALVIGNSTYDAVPSLQDPKRDVKTIGDALQKIGFNVMIETDLDQQGLLAALRKFARKAEEADWAVVYY